MQTNFRNLVFEGGGVKGIAYGGALSVLENRNIMQNIKRVAGTSAGAITAALLSVGYSAGEVSEIIAATNFADFEDKDAMLLSNVYRVWNKYGWFKGDVFTEWIRGLIKKKTNKSDFKFRDLIQRINSGEKNFRECYVVTTNLSQQKAEVLSHETYPDMNICDAVRMSMSIPIFFKAVLKENDVMVDGGVSWNYPINLFDYNKYVVNHLNAGAADYADDANYVFNYETLGFRLDAKDVIEYAHHQWALPPTPIKNIKDHASALLGFMMEMANKSHLHNNDEGRTVFIDTGAIKTTQFDLKKEELNFLLDSGTQNTIKFFELRSADAKLSTLPV